MDAIKELLASVRFQLSERVGNPLSGSFIIAWLLANFRLVIVILGEGGWETKLKYIDNTLYPTPKAWLLGAFWPLVAALLYVFAYPFISRWVIQFHRTRQKILREIAIKVEGETPITKEEKAMLLAKMRQSLRELEDLRAENATLADELARRGRQAEPLPLHTQQPEVRSVEPAAPGEPQPSGAKPNPTPPAEMIGEAEGRTRSAMDALVRVIGVDRVRNAIGSRELVAHLFEKAMEEHKSGGNKLPSNAVNHMRMYGLLSSDTSPSQQGIKELEKAAQRAVSQAEAHH